MTYKQESIDANNTMPRDASLDDIIDELCVLAATRNGRADIVASRFKTQEEVEQFVASWFPHSH